MRRTVYFYGKAGGRELNFHRDIPERVHGDHSTDPGFSDPAACVKGVQRLPVTTTELRMPHWDHQQNTFQGLLEATAELLVSAQVKKIWIYSGQYYRNASHVMCGSTLGQERKSANHGLAFARDGRKLVDTVSMEKIDRAAGSNHR